nr:atherin-like [Dasypus novemcinctus]
MANAGRGDTETTGKAAGTFTSSALNCRLLPPPPPAGTLAAAAPVDSRAGGEARRGPGTGRAARGAAPGRAGGLPRGGSRLSAPGSAPARPGPAAAAGTRAPALRGRPPAHTPGLRLPPRPPPVAPRHERRRWLQAESLPPRPPLAPVRRHYSLFAASGGDVRGCPAPPCPPSVPPALSGSCLLLLLLLPVVQAPPSLLSFAARISLEFYSLPHVTHRVKLHLRRVTHQHSASPSRPGHRQQQPPPTEEPQPGSQPAPPSAECAAAAHGNSRVGPEGGRVAPPTALETELAEAIRLRRRHSARRGEEDVARDRQADLSPISAFLVPAQDSSIKTPTSGSRLGPVDRVSDYHMGGPWFKAQASLTRVERAHVQC